MLEQINTAILSFSDAEILEMSYDEVESNIQETLRMHFQQLSYAELIVEHLKKIEGIKEIEILKDLN